ncbi:unnamed protein product [Psylliodes chrysocephalus]|uniref:Large ribosomal subunit protein bL9m n=1 Tax=Psylliodes chrysocephalus TaxID=3402493 RepID=A0A9P0GD54_9CUCU|nr:unnamed protein product [Psylliodes chrysocephala]
MWKTINSALVTSIKNQTVLQPINELLYQQIRTTYVLKRKTPPNLHKLGGLRKPLRSRHYIYDVIKNTAIERQPDIEVLLTSVVEGLGNVGDKVSVRPQFAYNNLLLPGLAVYASPENQEKYKDLAINTDVKKYSTPSAAYTVQSLSRMTLSVIMNKDVPWTLKPWHIKASFRKCGYVVPEYAIELPEQPITGPNMDIENKEFAITVTINKQEKVNVRCRLHHWSTELASRLPYVPRFWETPSEPILPEQKSILDTIPIKESKKKNAINN